MKRELIITTEPIDEANLVTGRRAIAGTGAVVYFTGLVRGTEDGAPIQALEYEAFEQMARHQFELIFQLVEQRWPIETLRLVHRIGRVSVGEPSLWVEVLAPHRGEAFAAGQFVIDEMKRRVPIWKRPVGRA